MEDSSSRQEYPDINSSHFVDSWKKAALPNERHSARSKLLAPILAPKFKHHLRSSSVTKTKDSMSFKHPFSSIHNSMEFGSEITIEAKDSVKNNNDNNSREISQTVHSVLKNLESSMIIKQKKDFRDQFAQINPTTKIPPLDVATEKEILKKIDKKFAEYQRNQSMLKQRASVSPIMPSRIDNITNNETNYVNESIANEKSSNRGLSLNLQPVRSTTEMPGGSVTNQNSERNPGSNSARFAFEPEVVIRNLFPQIESGLEKDLRRAILNGDENSPKPSQKGHKESWNTIQDLRNGKIKLKNSESGSIIRMDRDINATLRDTSQNNLIDSSRSSSMQLKKGVSLTNFSDPTVPQAGTIFEKHLVGPNMMISRLKTLIKMQVSELNDQREWYDQRLIKLLSFLQMNKKRRTVDPELREMLDTRGLSTYEKMGPGAYQKLADSLKGFMAKKNKKALDDHLKEKEREKIEEIQIALRKKGLHKKAASLGNNETGDVTGAPSLATYQVHDFLIKDKSKVMVGKLKKKIKPMYSYDENDPSRDLDLKSMRRGSNLLKPLPIEYLEKPHKGHDSMY